MTIRYIPQWERRPLLGLSICFIVLELLAIVEVIPDSPITCATWFHSPYYALSVASVAFFLWATKPQIRTIVSAGVGSAVIGLIFYLNTPPWTIATVVTYSMSALGLGALAALGYQAVKEQMVHPHHWHHRIILFHSLYLPIFVILSFGFLYLTSVLRPVTLDAPLFIMDQALLIDGSRRLYAFAFENSVFRNILSGAYNGLPLLFGAIYWAMPRQESRNIFMRTLLIATGVGYVFYAILPVTGPLYLFGNEFHIVTQKIKDLPLDLISTPQAPRNGLPSLHTTWSLILFYFALKLPMIWRIFVGGFAILVVMATLGLGEHYQIDILVSIPFAIGMIMISRKTWSQLYRDRYFVGSLLIFVLWTVFIAGLTGWTIDHPYVVLALALASVWLGCRYCVKVFRDQEFLTSALPKIAIESPPKEQWSDFRPTWMFFCSGFAALIYQVVYSKKLALVFGSTSLSSYTVLATYMAGLALGSIMGGLLIRRLTKPLLAYGLIEGLIGLLFLGSEQTIVAIRNLYVELAEGWAPGSALVTFWRVTLSSLCLMLPTVLMGMTLPLLVRYLTNHQRNIRQALGKLYAINTLGAASGTILAGYLFLPVLGVGSTTHIAAVINFGIAAYAIALWLKSGHDHPKKSEPVPQPSLSFPAVFSRRQAISALAALFLAGIVTMGLEVNYFHILAIVVGNSTYAFTLMVFAFLVGLSLGAYRTRQLSNDSSKVAAIAFYSQCGLCCSILIAVFILNHVPSYFNQFSNYPLTKTFAIREFIRALICLLVMIPPAFLIGAIFTLLTSIVTLHFRSEGEKWIGLASGLNTTGNILGVCLFGFVLLPTVGGLKAFQIAATMVGLAAIVIFAAFYQQISRWHALGFLVVLALLYGLQPPQFDINLLSTGANVYFKGQSYGTAIDYRENIEGGLTSVTVRTDPDQPNRSIKTLLTNGKFQGDNGPEMKAQAGFALVPLLYTDHRDQALVIGYGTGLNSRIIEAAGFKKLDIVELAEDIIIMANKHFNDINEGVTDKENVKVHITDGRNFLLLHENSYDLITMEITSVWFAGASSLYNQEFYELARKRLNQDGILQQWIQIHRVSPRDILAMIASIRVVFPHTALHILGNQGIIVASLSPLHQKQQRIQSQNLSSFVRDFPGGIETILASCLIGDTDFSQHQWHHLVSTDDNMFLEYSTPKGNVNDYTASYQSNFAWLKKLGKSRCASHRTNIPLAPEVH